MKYDWQIERLEKRVDELEAFVVRLRLLVEDLLEDLIEEEEE